MGPPSVGQEGKPFLREGTGRWTVAALSRSSAACQEVREWSVVWGGNWALIDQAGLHWKWTAPKGVVDVSHSARMLSDLNAGCPLNVGGLITALSAKGQIVLEAETGPSEGRLPWQCLANAVLDSAASLPTREPLYLLSFPFQTCFQ